MMARSRFLWDAATQKWAPAHEVLAKRAAERPNRASLLPRPMVIGDSISGGLDGIKSMADGQHYTSRRAYERSVARAGCEVVGFDRNWTDHVKPTYDEKSHEADVVADIKKSIEQVSSL